MFLVARSKNYFFKFAMEILTTKTLAEYIGRSPAAIRNMVMRRDIPYRKVAGVLTFKKCEIDRWIDSSTGLSFEQWQQGKEVRKNWQE